MISGTKAVVKGANMHGYPWISLGCGFTFVVVWQPTHKVGQSSRKPIQFVSPE